MGIHRCDEKCLDRWWSDDYRFPPYQYRVENLVQDRTGLVRYLNSTERARLLGFTGDHLVFCWSAGKVKADPRGWEDAKLSLAGDSFSMLSFGWISSQLCKAWSPPMSPEHLIARMGLAPGSSLAPEFTAPMTRAISYGHSEGAPTRPEALVSQIARHVDITGSDVSLAAGSPFVFKTANHASLRAGWWDWKVIFKNQWKHESHINALEMRMVLLSLKWRSRFPCSLNKRWLHLADSMVCNYILSKGRTSSRLLAPITQTVAAYLLALNSVQLHGHVDSLENPTDEASREADDSQDAK